MSAAVRDLRIDSSEERPDGDSERSSDTLANRAVPKERKVGRGRTGTGVMRVMKSSPRSMLHWKDYYDLEDLPLEDVEYPTDFDQ
jgi:hypothetical protein